MKRFFLAVAGPSFALSGLSCNVALVDCSKVSLDVCGNTQGCLALEAQPVRAPDDASMTCLMPLQFVSCGGQRTCDKVLPSRTKDPAGKEWVLQSPCVPAGWTQTHTNATINDCATCQSLSVPVCTTTDYCRTFSGRRIYAPQSCLLGEHTVGCTDVTANCELMASRLFDLQGEEWIVPGRCIPSGWHDSASRNTTLGICALADGGVDQDGSSDGDGASADCASLSVTACAATAGCQVIEGQPIDHQRACVKPRQAVGCQRPAFVLCGQAVTRATDPNGVEWSFSSTCIPTGWTNATGTDAYFPDCSSLRGPDAADH